MKIIPPSKYEKSYTCPHCGVYARQLKWGFYLVGPNGTVFNESHVADAPLTVAICDHCKQNGLWVGEEEVYPVRSFALPANPDMPTEILADYEEAASIYKQSPRGAAALLRLSVQKLMVHLGQPGKNINDDIAALVANGLPKQIQQALDVVRITGNNAVHPGKLDADDAQVAQQLFPLVNLIVEYQISMPARVQELYDALPSGARAGIERRDAC